MKQPTAGGLESRLGYEFHDRALLTRALTHRSHGSANNERLEFLGDAVLDVIVSSVLFARFPEASEGDLSRLRARLVRKPALAEMARSLALADDLLMGSGEMKTAGNQRESTLSDAFEAIVGAMYLDAGIDTVSERVKAWFADAFAALSLNHAGKDPKSRLQEHLQGLGKPLPRYKVEAVRGDAHQQTFVVSCHCEIDGGDATGEGKTRRYAEQQAAASILQQIGGNA